ncbi:MAG: ABC transporter substrate-binding protein [Candidatus Aminicenantes bacterium]|nr:ABC transporter substrate-binding protein [Candidatus Aminicenantes bacterium]
MILLLPLGCKPGTSSSNSNSQTQSSSYITIPTRLVTASPGITEIVYALGKGDHIIGVSNFTIFPPAAKNKPKIGGLFNPNLEILTALQPELVITQGKHESLAQFCRNQEIDFLSVNMDSLEDVFSAIYIIGSKLDREANADHLVSQLKRELDEIREKTGRLTPKKVFITLGHTPGDLTGLMTTTSGTFLNEIIEIAGGKNIFANLEGLYPHISKEALLMRQPDIIIEIFPEGFSVKNKKMLKKDWQRLDILTAVKTGNIHYLTDDYLLIPGMRIPMAAIKMAQIIHPGIFDYPGN